MNGCDYDKVCARIGGYQHPMKQQCDLYLKWSREDSPDKPHVGNFRRHEPERQKFYNEVWEKRIR